jgi:spermidine synthase
MLCSDATALLTPLIYRNVARLLAPGGLFVISSVNEAESGWFGECVVSSLIEHGGEGVTWQIEVHSPSNYTDGEEGAPHVYIIRKSVQPPERARGSTQKQREPYTIKQTFY